MSDDDLSFAALLDRLPVPDHGPGFWEELEAHLAGTPEVTAAADDGRRRLRSVDTELGDPSESERDPDGRTRVRWLGLALSAAAVVIVAAIVGLRLFGDDDPPTITDTPTTTLVPDVEDDSAPEGAAPPEPLEWSPAGAAAGPGGESAPIPTWVGSQFAVVNWSDETKPPIEVSPDGRTWSALEGLPEGFEPRSIAGWGDSLVVAASPTFDIESPGKAEVALSLDRGETWQVLPGAGPEPPSSPHLSYFTAPGGIAVIGDTVLLSTIPRAQVDLSSALDAAGTPLEDGAWADLAWLDGEWRVKVCEPIAVGVECAPEPRYRLADLGIDPAEMPVGRGENFSPQWSAFYRSTGGGPFTEVDVDIPLGNSMRVDVVADHFVVSTSSLAYDADGSIVYDDEGAAVMGPFRIWRSTDAVEWTISETELDPITMPLVGSMVGFATTDDALVALRDGQAVRSVDVGRTWDPVATPAGVEVRGIHAGPGGVILVGWTPPAPLEFPDEITKDGYTIALEDGLVVRGSDGRVVASLSRSSEAPEGAPVLEPVDTGPVFYELRDPVTGEVLLEILDADVRDLSGLRSGDDCSVDNAHFVAWSADGTSFEWVPADEAFGGEGTADLSVEQVAVGIDTAVASVHIPGPSLPADFRAVTEFRSDTSPVAGQATICHGTGGTSETFVADLP